VAKLSQDRDVRPVDTDDAVLAAAGDAHAFERLYHRHVARIHSLARRMIGAELADEVAQDVFVRAWEKLGSFRGEAAFGTWLHRVAINVILGRRKQLGIRRDRFVDGEKAIGRMSSNPKGAETAIDFEAAMVNLPNGAQQVFVLHDVEGYKHGEIAEMLGITAGTSKSQLHRARMILRGLSEFLDGGLDAAERADLEAHLADCEECVATLEQLRRVASRAQTLEDRPPENDLWSGIAERIGVTSTSPAVTDIESHRERKRARIRDRRVSFSLPQLAAAGIALMIMSGGVGLLLSGSGDPVGEMATAANPVGTVAIPAASPGIPTLANYDAAVADLERVIEESRDQLDTMTVRIIQENLLIIDRAIAQAQRALALDPASVYLNEHLAATMHQKLEFLRRAAQMTGAVS
jgi:RNA polymerase sigma-70 factor (ECF subfamily)